MEKNSRRKEPSIGFDRTSAGMPRCFARLDAIRSSTVQLKYKERCVSSIDKTATREHSENSVRGGRDPLGCEL